MRAGEYRSLPKPAAAVVGALRFGAPCGREIEPLNDREWGELLSFCDRSQLTLAYALACGARRPEWVEQRLRQNLSDNTERTAKVQSAFFEVARALDEKGIEFITLKGMAQWPDYITDLRHRVQYDIDLLCPTAADQARLVLSDLGYEPGHDDGFPCDHLPSMVRWNGWKPDGNYFNPRMPVAIDVHFRLWDPKTERFAAPGVEEFWQRRTLRQIESHCVPVLHSADGLAYCALHALRHLLRGSLKLYHIFEIAYFLDGHAEDGAFWERWRELHGERLRQLEGVVFSLAEGMFGCRLPEAVQREVASLPDGIAAWLESFALSPVRGYFQPNKDEVWLHLHLLNSIADKAAVIRRRVLPLKLPSPQVATPRDAGPAERARARVRYAGHLVSRFSHHVRAAIPFAGAAIKQRLPRAYWEFLGAAVLYNLGLFVFFVLYNLHLLRLGFAENFLGWVTSAMMAGSVAGALPAGALSRRLGLRRTLVFCFASFAAITLVRAMATGPPLLLASAFASGFVAAFWAVSIPPAVARLTEPESRALGYSVLVGVNIGVGILGGVAAGRLPEWLGLVPGLRAAGTPIQLALIVGCALMALAAWPASRLRFGPEPPRGPTLFPRGRFMGSYLAVLAIWTLATAAFNPFFNAYFAQRFHASVGWIGGVFSLAQAMQVLAILCAPLVFRRAGLVAGIAWTQLAAAVALAGLAAGPTRTAGVLAYLAYASFQWMSEPGMYTLLMKNVRDGEQSGASGMNFFVSFSCQAIAAAVAGGAFARFGYPTVLAAAALMAGTAAALFRLLLTRFEERSARSTRALRVGSAGA